MTPDTSASRYRRPPYGPLSLLKQYTVPDSGENQDFLHLDSVVLRTILAGSIMIALFITLSTICSIASHKCYSPVSEARHATMASITLMFSQIVCRTIQHRMIHSSL